MFRDRDYAARLLLPCHTYGGSSEQQPRNAERIAGPNIGTHSAMLQIMAGGRHEQLSLRFFAQGNPTVHVVPELRIPRMVTRDARVLTRAGAPATARRMRRTPPRDRRGRFVALPTTAAPSWYVF